MFKTIVRCVLGTLAATAAGAVFASQVSVLGTYTSTASGGVFSSEPSRQERDAALAGAKLNAWRAYAGRFTQSRTRQLTAHEKEADAKIDQFLSNVNVVDEEFDKKTGTFKVAVRAVVNETRVDEFFSQLGGAAKRGDGGLMAFIFLARQQDSVKSFDAKRTQIDQVSVSTTAGETTVDSSSGAAEASGEQASVTKTNKRVTGGSTERKSDRIAYRVSSSENIDAAMSDALTTGGYEIASYADIVAECGGETLEKIRGEYVASDELSVPTRKKLLDGARACEVRFMATGTLDIGAPDTDPVSGSRRVVVSVRGQVLDLQQKLPRRVASVGPIQYSGLGADEQIAMRNALNNAAKASAHALIDQLNAKGIQ
jgi:hypothetical protein